MNVLYDISILGRCAQDPTKFNGVPRVVATLGEHLLHHHSSCQVTFSAVDGAEDAYQFVTAEPALRSGRCARTPILDHCNIWVRRQMDAAYRAGGTDIGSRVRLAALHRIGGRLPKPLINPSTARRANVFHTPCAAIPPELRRFGHLVFFQTIYDMLLKTIPETFTPDQYDYVKRVFDNLRPTDWILTDSFAARNDICEYLGTDPSRVFVTHLAADSRKFRPCGGDLERLSAARRKYGIPTDARYFLSLCTLTPHKNLAHVVQAFTDLIQSESNLASDTYLVLAGGSGRGADRFIYEIAALPARARDRIVLTGYVNDEDLAPLYSGALAFVFMSLYEGFGLPPLEAMQCGTPVIASNTSSLPEVVGDAGILLDPKDRDGLCQAMRTLCNDTALCAEMVIRSLQQAKKFNWERCARETVQAYSVAREAGPRA